MFLPWFAYQECQNFQLNMLNLCAEFCACKKYYMRLSDGRFCPRIGALMIQGVRYCISAVLQSRPGLKSEWMTVIVACQCFISSAPVLWHAHIITGPVRNCTNGVTSFLAPSAVSHRAEASWSKAHSQSHALSCCACTSTLFRLASARCKTL